MFLAAVTAMHPHCQTLMSRLSSCWSIFAINKWSCNFVVSQSLSCHISPEQSEQSPRKKYIIVLKGLNKKMTGETPEVHSDKRKPREKKREKREKRGKKERKLREKKEKMRKD